MIVTARNGWYSRHLVVEALDVVHDRRLAGTRVADHQQIAGNLAGGVLVDRNRHIAQRPILTQHAAPELFEDVGWTDLHQWTVAGGLGFGLRLRDGDR